MRECVLTLIRKLKKAKEKYMYDIIIIGAGPAGLTAAIYARRAEKSVLIIEKEAFGGQMASSPCIENYPGFESVSGSELADKMVSQALALGTEIELAEVTSVTEGGAPDYAKLVHCGDDTFEAKAVIIAVGARHRRLGLDREEDFIGNGISFCATCDGAFYSGKSVIVIGGGNSALIEALSLSDICTSVTILQNLDFLTGEAKLRDAIYAKENVKVVTGVTVESIIGGEEFEGVSIRHTSTSEVERVLADGAFVAIGLEPKNEPFESLSSLDDAGYLITDESCSGETPGVFIAGDCRTKRVRQIATAVADGASAALAAVRFLS